MWSATKRPVREPPSYRYDVFVSYSHADRAWVWDELLPGLESAGLRVCIDDRDFKIGEPILTNIERASTESHRTLVVLSPAWLSSEWTELEALLLQSNDPSGRRVRLLPVLLEPCELPRRIAMLHLADFTQHEGRASGVARLARQLADESRIARPLLSPSGPTTFSAGPPIVDPRHFFGRERELKRLFNLWKHTPLQNAAIVGPRRSGKSSLLLYLKSIATTPPDRLRVGQRSDWLPAPERYRWVFVDFQDPRLGTQAGLLRHLLTGLELPSQGACDLDGFLETASRHLLLPSIVLLDEVGVALQRYPELDDSFWEGLRALATTQVGGNLGFGLATHEQPQQVAEQSGLGSPFFNIFGYAAALGPLTEPEARELIASSPIPFPTDDENWILVQSGRWPILVQILCRERLITLEAGEIDADWQKEALEQMAPFRHLLGT
jgi:hypothetical protein